MEQAEVRRELHEGFGDAMTRAFELVLVPLLFGFVGHVLDTKLHTGNLLMLVLGIVGLVGTMLKLFYVYRYKMAQVEKDMPWNR